MKRILLTLLGAILLLSLLPRERATTIDTIGKSAELTPIVNQLPIKYEQVETVAFKPKPVSKPVQAVSASGWHRECRSQTEAVRQAVFSLGLGSDWEYIHYIFSHESCVDPGRENPIGCRGLGQSCGHASFTCGPEDIVCQINWFNNYAQGKGGWYRSYQIWLGKHWW